MIEDERFPGAGDHSAISLDLPQYYGDPDRARCRFVEMRPPSVAT
jgi:hypothetical protein